MLTDAFLAITNDNYHNPDCGKNVIIIIIIYTQLTVH